MAALATTPAATMTMVPPFVNKYLSRFVLRPGRVPWLVSAWLAASTLVQATSRDAKRLWRGRCQ